jgi:peroxiredoxin Q/BCP
MLGGKNMIETILKEQTNAPNVDLLGSDKLKHKLSDYLGKKIVLYFYPKDNTPGCSIEAQDFRDNIKTFEEMNTIVIGVSRDSINSHDKFIDKFCLPFLLLSDENEVASNLYGVLKEKIMFGKKSIGIERSTFIIDENGVIRKIYRKVRVANHVNTIIKELQAL